MGSISVDPVRLGEFSTDSIQVNWTSPINLGMKELQVGWGTFATGLDLALQNKQFFAQVPLIGEQFVLALDGIEQLKSEVSSAFVLLLSSRPETISRRRYLISLGQTS